MGIFKTSPNIGIALGGGGAARGIVHLGVLKAFEKAGGKLHCISGTSSGSFVASLYAFGVKLQDIYEIFTHLTWFKLSDLTLNKGGLFTNENISKTIKDYLGDVNIEDSKIPLAIVASDIVTGKRAILRTGPLADAVRASCCAQGLFAPVRLDNRLLTDGGIVENVPISPLKKMGAEFIYAVNLNGQPIYQEPKNFIDVLANTLDIAIDTTTRLQLKQANAVLNFDLHEFDRINWDRAEDLYELGFSKAKECFETLDPRSAWLYYKSLRSKRIFK